MIDVLRNPPDPRLLSEVIVFVARDETGVERIMTAPVSGGVPQPLVFSDRDAAAAVVPVAQDIAERTGCSYRILRYFIREDVTDQF